MRSGICGCSTAAAIMSYSGERDGTGENGSRLSSAEGGASDLSGERRAGRPRPDPGQPPRGVRSEALPTSLLRVPVPPLPPEARCRSVGRPGLAARRRRKKGKGAGVLPESFGRRLAGWLPVTEVPSPPDRPEKGREVQQPKCPRSSTGASEGRGCSCRRVCTGAAHPFARCEPLS